MPAEPVTNLPLEDRRLGRERLFAPLVVLVALVAWETLSRAGLVSALFFPAPSVIAVAFLRLLRDGTLLSHLLATLRRLATGFVAGALPALVLGLAMGRSRRLRAAIDPLVASVHPIPKIAVLPLIMIIFGIGEISRVVLIAAGAFFPILINTMAGVRQISPIHFEVAQNYGASPLKLFTRVLFPGSLPMILAGVRLGLNISLLLAITSEVVLSGPGLGRIIWNAWETLRTEEIYASLVVIACLGVAFSLTLQYLTRRLVPWQAEHEV
ncbi:MAG: ABC transporter permease [Planctomycetota bacterium]